MITFWVGHLSSGWHRSEVPVTAGWWCLSRPFPAAGVPAPPGGGRPAEPRGGQGHVRQLVGPGEDQPQADGLSQSPPHNVASRRHPSHRRHHV